MVIIAVILAFLLCIAGFLLVFQALRYQDLQRKYMLTVQHTLNLLKMQADLIHKRQEVPVDKLLAAMGTAVKDIISGQPMVVNENMKQETPAEEGPYYPDVEFDEWLGSEGLPPAAGWWSPPRSVEPNENIN